ncbi:MAG: VWA domain-containing protein [Pyrinomonadaceae bacterium]|nr:VWA domain-containing protein [Pyrinomonadaceae bacterium]
MRDKQGRFVDTLHPEDLTISENKASREILKLERKTNEPLSVAILIDTSASQERTLAGTKLAAQKFVESILRSGKDRAALVSFTAEATIEQDLTNDLTSLRAAIDRVKFVPPSVLGGVVLGPTPPPLGGTAIWDAIWATVDGIQAAAGSRRVIVLLTDGEDTMSKLKQRDAIEQAATNDVAIFSIGIADDKYVGLNRGSLKRLSEETGGRAFFPKKVADLDGIFSEVAQALQSQYVLSYCAANQKPTVKRPRIEVEVKNPQLRQSNLQLSYPRFGS